MAFRSAWAFDRSSSADTSLDFVSARDTLRALTSSACDAMSEEDLVGEAPGGSIAMASVVVETSSVLFGVSNDISTVDRVGDRSNGLEIGEMIFNCSDRTIDGVL